MQLYPAFAWGEASGGCDDIGKHPTKTYREATAELPKPWHSADSQSYFFRVIHCSGNGVRYLGLERKNVIRVVLIVYVGWLRGLPDNSPQINKNCNTGPHFHLCDGNGYPVIFFSVINATPTRLVQMDHHIRLPYAYPEIFVTIHIEEMAFCQLAK